MLEQTVGVAVFVLRHTPAHQTEVLLLKRAFGRLAGSWSPVAGTLAPGEPEADAALRELLEETALRPARFYATPFSASNQDPELGPVGRIGVFVAYVEHEAAVSLDRESDGFAWQPAREAAPFLPRADQREVMARIVSEFVRRPPDEALRIA